MTRVSGLRVLELLQEKADTDNFLVFGKYTILELLE